MLIANRAFILPIHYTHFTARACWLSAWIKIQLKNMIVESLKTGADLPERYHRLFKIWFILGWPAFVGLVIGSF